MDHGWSLFVFHVFLLIYKICLTQRTQLNIAIDIIIYWMKFNTKSVFTKDDVDNFLTNTHALKQKEYIKHKQEEQNTQKDRNKQEIQFQSKTQTQTNT